MVNKFIIFVISMMGVNTADAVVPFCENLSPGSIKTLNNNFSTPVVDSDGIALRIPLKSEIGIIKKDDINRLLISSSQLGIVAFVKEFIIYGANINWRDKRAEFSVTPLTVAAWCEHSDVVDILLGSGADVDVDSVFPFGGNMYSDRVPPLHAAVVGNDYSGGNLHIIKSILNKGAEEDARDGYGMTIWDYIDHMDFDDARRVFSVLRKNNE